MLSVKKLTAAAIIATLAGSASADSNNWDGNWDNFGDFISDFTGDGNFDFNMDFDMDFDIDFDGETSQYRHVYTDYATYYGNTPNYYGAPAPVATATRRVVC